MSGMDLSADGTKMVYSPDSGPDAYNVILRNLSSGSETTLFDASSQGASFKDARFSPDETKVIGTIDGDIYSLSVASQSLTLLVDFPDSLSSPVMSPDGKLAFLAYGTPVGDNFGEADGPRRMIYVVNDDLAEPHLVTPLSSIKWAGPPGFSPTGDEIVYEAWTGTQHVDLRTNLVTSLTTTVPNAWGVYPEWEVGDTLLVDDAASINRVNMSTGHQDNMGQMWHTQTIRRRHTLGTADPPRAGAVEGQRQLDRYAPEMRYDPSETYRADAANEITDNYRSGGHTNSLWTDPAGDIAWSDPDHEGSDLTIDTLGPEYQNIDDYSEDPFYAIEADHLNEDNDDYAGDAQRLHDQGGYNDQIYGRVVDDLETGERTLQYWFFYYYNSKSYGLNIGVHEGDWEMAQVHLDSDWEPVGAEYAQHDGGERCGWDQVEKADGHPVVYVARDSHASYFTNGFEGFHSGDDDHTGTDGEHVVPAVNDVTYPPAWFWWPGKWGGSDTSPQGPTQGGNADKWNDPRAWGSSIDSCNEDSGFAPQSQRDSRVTTSDGESGTVADDGQVSVLGHNGYAYVEYTPAKGQPSAARAAQALLVTAPSPGHGIVPLSRSYPLKGRGLRVKFRYGLGRPPRALIVQIGHKNGQLSEASKVRIEPPSTD